MTRRWGYAYEWVYRYLALRDGEVCYICKKRVDKKGNSLLIVEHKDNDPHNYAPENLALAHRSCNTRKDPPNIFPRALPSEVVCVSNPQANLQAQAREPAPSVRFEDGYAVNKNREAEPLFRRWVFAIIKNNKDHPVSEKLLIRNGAEFVGISVKTAERYMEKLKSEIFGPLMETLSDKGPIIIFKEYADYDLSIEELEKKYPWGGVFKSENLKALSEREKDESKVEAT